MKLLLWTRGDPASLRLAGTLVALGHFPKAEGDGWLRVDEAFQAALARVEGSLLWADFADRRVAAQASMPFERVLFLSKHSAASGQPAFTVHPIGNLGGEAVFGGAARTLVPPDPGYMTSLLSALAGEAADLGVTATFEATHHGPQMALPSLFVEVGSRPQDWENGDLVAGVARAVVEGYLKPTLPEPLAPALGLGGGHYHPRQTDRARAEGTAVGHLIPLHALADLHDATLNEAVRLTRAKVCLLDARKDDHGALERARAFVEARGLSTARIG